MIGADLRVLAFLPTLQASTFEGAKNQFRGASGAPVVPMSCRSTEWTESDADNREHFQSAVIGLLVARRLSTANAVIISYEVT